MTKPDPYFTRLQPSLDNKISTDLMPDPFVAQPPTIAVTAALKLQKYLTTQNDFVHNFGLDPKGTAPIIGKMFGVLVVLNGEKELGYLSAFSGKLAGTNSLPHFVPPVYDSLKDTGFLTPGMKTLNQINSQISKLVKTGNQEEEIETLKKERKQLSRRLQEQLFDKYQFLNTANEEKGVREIFKEYSGTKPPAAAGECTAPKLFQHAFKHAYKPIAIAEFWWGQSPKSVHWKHGQFYPACEEKCRPILDFMLL